jgi:hypothetical protein
MFLDRSVPRINREYERFQFARNLRDDIVRRIQECIDTGALPATTKPSVAFRLLTLPLIGLAAHHLSDRLTASESADDLARDLVNVAIAGLQAGVPLRSTGWDAECLGPQEPENRAKVS